MDAEDGEKLRAVGKSKKGTAIYMTVLKFLIPKSSVTFLYDYNTVRRGIDTIKKSGYTAVPVITKDGEYFGTVSEGDFLSCILDGDESNCFGENVHLCDMIRRGFNPAIHVDDSVGKLLSQLTEQNFVPVVDDKGSFIGIITRKDVLCHLFKNYLGDDAAK